MTGGGDLSAQADADELVGPPLFADDFESGDVCAWSAMQPPRVWYLDADGDSFGDPASSVQACVQPFGYVADASDCDDASVATFPGAAPLDSASQCMLDQDGDDFGDVSPPSGVAAGTDCDDADVDRNPGALEMCNGIDDDCDVGIDEGFDLDLDGWTSCGGDCNDDDADVHPLAPDDPEPAFMDSNCDGIDGDRTRAAFVATNGTDTGSCRLEAPCATLQFALALVASDPVLEQVFLQAGLYAEGGLELPDGVEVFGGYNSSWERAERNQPGHTAEISGGYVAALDASYTVRVDQASAGMADLVLVGPSAAFPSLSSHVVLAREASLWLQRVTLVLGDGADGAAGSTGIGANPAPAPAGGPGEPGDEFESVCDLYRPPGGPGASNPQCPGAATAGGAGGSGGSMDTNCNGPLGSCGNCDARPGLSGSAGGGSGSTGGTGGGLCGGFPGSGSSTAPSDGAGGAPAPPGGYIDVAGTWRANAGLAGAVGSHGFGGGGGGGAGGCDIGADDRGPGGGGGGAGGCRAPLAGGGGAGGGGSLGIVAVDSAVSIEESLFLLGLGGDGGAGGAGAAGQPGGLGGPGGAATTNTVPGGIGGAGSRGGHAGGGGGGAGGRVCGIVSLNSSVTQAGNLFQGGTAGSGGAAGPSPGFPGAAGPSGTVTTQCVCAAAGSC